MIAIQSRTMFITGTQVNNFVQVQAWRTMLGPDMTVQLLLGSGCRIGAVILQQADILDATEPKEIIGSVFSEARTQSLLSKRAAQIRYFNSGGWRNSGAHADPRNNKDRGKIIRKKF